MEHQKKAYIFAILAVLLWSTVATAFKIALRDFPPEIMLLYASISATLVLFIFFIFDKTASKIKLIDFKKSALAGLFNPFIYYLILFEAYDLLPAQIAQPLNYTWPIVLSIFSAYYFKQKLRIGIWIGLLVSFTGVVLISAQTSAFGELNSWGIFLALFSSIVWSTYWIINMKDKRANSKKLFLNFLLGSVFVFCYILLKQESFKYNTEAMLASIYIGFFEMGITFFFWMKALSLTQQTAKINNLVFLSPFLSFFLIALILEEKIQLMSIIGLIVIILGIILQKLIKK